MKTLIIEDNSTFRKTFREALLKTFPSMVIEEAIDGVEATKKVETFQPDLVFMDIRLPGENGLELTKKIKVSHPEIHIIILTNYNLQEYRKAAFDSGADDFIVKGSLNAAAIEETVKSFFLDRDLD
jgi:DNA-binding NarL/FixJ family response regulator